jgi:hypothetical protein
MHVFHRLDIGELRRSRPRDGDQRFAGRIGDQMQVKVVAGAMRHSQETTEKETTGKTPDGLWIAGEEATASGRAQASGGTGCKYVPTAAPKNKFQRLPTGVVWKRMKLLATRRCPGAAR